MGSVQAMIEYIVKYQNNYISSFLFKRIFSTLMAKGIKVEPILRSKIFRFEFYFEEWPSSSIDNTEIMKPYNGTVFELRRHYKTMFHEL